MKTIDVLVTMEVPDEYAEDESLLIQTLDSAITSPADKIKMLYADKALDAKVWTEEDVKTILESKGYKTSAKNVKAVIDTGLLTLLDDCFDEEWDIIANAVTAANEKYGLE